MTDFGKEIGWKLEEGCRRYCQVIDKLQFFDYNLLTDFGKEIGWKLKEGCWRYFSFYNN
ncbi:MULTISPECIES: hypothetical protein [Chryseobacterium]|uniref:hypothetical protein n=1 Tax=Chryseobacterium TaxID=59732 RepID=UPI0013DE5162|nr:MULTISPECIES: hypothetical protein [Chryseobacterium]